MRTTKQHYLDFQKYAKKWQEKLGVSNWAVYFYHRSLEDAYASTAWQMSGAVATMTFCTNWDNGRELNDAELERVALHEVLHLLMAELISQAEARYTMADSIEIAEHSIIRRLESVLV